MYTLPFFIQRDTHRGLIINTIKIIIQQCQKYFHDLAWLVPLPTEFHINLWLFIFATIWLKMLITAWKSPFYSMMVLLCSCSFHHLWVICGQIFKSCKTDEVFPVPSTGHFKRLLSSCLCSSNSLWCFRKANDVFCRQVFISFAQKDWSCAQAVTLHSGQRCTQTHPCIF